MDKIAMGIIGVGGWGELHATVYAYEPQVDLVAVCDLDASRASHVAEQHGAKRHYTDYRELLADKDIRAVSIVTPDFSHTEIAVAAAEAGKDILLEKPMATTVEECERIGAAAKKAGVTLMVDFHNRWNPIFYKARSAIERGQLGVPKLIYLRLNDQIMFPAEHLPWAGKSSIAWFVGSHCVDLTSWLFDDEVRRVFSVARSGVLEGMGIPTPDFFETVLEYKKGGVAVVENCWILPGTTPAVIDFKCEVIGTEGVTYMDGAKHRAYEKYTKDVAKYSDVLVRPTVFDKPIGFAVESIRYFVECLVKNQQPCVGAAEGTAATRIICAVNESVKTGIPVELD